MSDDQEETEPAPSERPAPPLDYEERRQQPRDPLLQKSERIMLGFLVYALACGGWYAFTKWAKFSSRDRTVGFIQITVLFLSVAVFLRIRYRVSGTGYGVLIGIAVWLLILAGVGCLSAMTCGGPNLGP
jgi:hypothetical protein